MKLKKGLNYGLNLERDAKKASKFKSYSPCNLMKYGLKAARRAPQFSKR